MTDPRYVNARKRDREAARQRVRVARRGDQGRRGRGRAAVAAPTRPQQTKKGRSRPGSAIRRSRRRSSARRAARGAVARSRCSRSTRSTYDCVDLEEPEHEAKLAPLDRDQAEHRAVRLPARSVHRRLQRAVGGRAPRSARGRADERRGAREGAGPPQVRRDRCAAEHRRTRTGPRDARRVSSANRSASVRRNEERVGSLSFYIVTSRASPVPRAHRAIASGSFDSFSRRRAASDLLPPLRARARKATSRRMSSTRGTASQSGSVGTT